MLKRLTERIGCWLAREMIDEMRDQRLSLRTALAHAANQYRDMAAARADVLAELNEATRRIGDLVATASELKSAVEDQDYTIDRLRSCLADQKQQFREIVSARATVVRENERLREEVATLRSGGVGSGSWSGLVEGR